MKKINIIGCGGHARSVAQTILSDTPETELKFIDDNARPNEKIWKYEVTDQSPSTEENAFIALGDNRARAKLSERHPRQINVISSRAVNGLNLKLGIGILIAPGAYLGPDVSIGDGTIVNTHSIIEHETSVGSFCHIAPNATICGRCRIGDNVFIGAGAVVKDKITICSDVIIGAGSVVIKDICEPGTYSGCPVRRHKKS